MRLTVVVVVLLALVAMGSNRVSTVAAQPILQAQVASPPTETDIVKWSFTQGALTLVLVLTLISYRRDFFRKIEMKQSEVDVLREEKQMLRHVLEANALAVQRLAVVTAENTKATELLAQNVNNLAERRSGHR